MTVNDYVHIVFNKYVNSFILNNAFLQTQADKKQIHSEFRVLSITKTIK